MEMQSITHYGVHSNSLFVIWNPLPSTRCISVESESNLFTWRPLDGGLHGEGPGGIIQINIHFIVILIPSRFALVYFILNLVELKIL